jgi:hypothetical protein
MINFLAANENKNHSLLVLAIAPGVAVENAYTGGVPSSEVQAYTNAFLLPRPQKDDVRPWSEPAGFAWVVPGEALLAAHG